MFALCVDLRCIALCCVALCCVFVAMRSIVLHCIVFFCVALCWLHCLLQCYIVLFLSCWFINHLRWYGHCFTQPSFSFHSPKEKQRDAVFHDIVTEDRLECKFNVNSYKIVYVSGTEDFMYRRNSMSRATKVCSLDVLNEFISLLSN